MGLFVNKVSGIKWTKKLRIATGDALATKRWRVRPQIAPTVCGRVRRALWRRGKILKAKAFASMVRLRWTAAGPGAGIII